MNNEIIWNENINNSFLKYVKTNSNKEKNNIFTKELKDPIINLIDYVYIKYKYNLYFEKNKFEINNLKLDILSKTYESINEFELNIEKLKENKNLGKSYLITRIKGFFICERKIHKNNKRNFESFDNYDESDFL